MFIDIPLPRRLLIGLSGGADSMALAHLLLERRAAGDVELCAVHVNHGLRDAEADADEAFVTAWCERRGLEVMCFRLTPPPHPGEDWARQARYGCFRRAAERFRADAVALAHHRDDQAETVLMHLLRGAGTTGLAGMQPDGETLGVRVIRPLLDVSRQELRDVLASAGVPWREDATNQEPRYLRNAVRLQLLPLMEQLAPGAAEHIAAAAKVLRGEDEALCEMAERFLAEHGGAPWLPLGPLEAVHPALAGRILRLWWQEQNAPEGGERSLNHRQTEALAALIHAPAGTKCNLPGGRHGVRGWTHIHLTGGDAHPVSVKMTLTPGADGPGDGVFTQAVPAGLMDDCCLRTRRHGDWIRPYGGAGRQSLQDYLVNKRVDAPFRDSVPLVCRGSEVLLAAGVGAGHLPDWSQYDQRATVRWSGDMPWTHK